MHIRKIPAVVGKTARHPADVTSDVVAYAPVSAHKPRTRRSKEKLLMAKKRRKKAAKKGRKKAAKKGRRKGRRRAKK
jgi:hypothetical protein